MSREVPESELWSALEQKDVPESHRVFVRSLLARAYVRGQFAEFERLLARLEAGLLRAGSWRDVFGVTDDSTGHGP